MAEYTELIQTLALTLGVAWASGLNLYAAVGALGLAGAFGQVDLPPGLEAIQSPEVILAAGFMYCVEFMADKTPGIDTAWDSLHTFVRIPAGALLAVGAAGSIDPTLAIVAGLLGGSVSAATHAAKAGTRVLINTSPEPFSNWAASLAEDVAVVAGLWGAVSHPVLFLLVLLVFLVALCWLLPVLARSIRGVLRRVGSWLGLVRSDRAGSNLRQLLEAGVLTEAEYRVALARVST